MNNTDPLKPAYDLIYLVSCSVNGHTPDKAKCAEMDVAAVFKAACRHALTVAAALALEQVMRLPDYFTEEEYKAIRRLSLFDAERVRIISEMEARKIWYMPLKGIVMKDYYPQAEMREMSDNDILFDEQKADEVKAIMESAGYSCLVFNKIHHDVYHKGSFVTFEMHREVFDKHSDPMFVRYFRDTPKRMIKDEQNSFGYHLAPEEFYIMLIAHLFKHYRNEGTGLRALLDIYVFNHFCEKKLNTQDISQKLEALKLTDFERETKALAEKLFTLQPLSAEEQKEAEYYISSNSHGTTENRIAAFLDNDDSRKAKRRYAMERIFPSQESIHRNHPLVSRHKALYPLLVMYRPFKGIVKHRKQIKNEIDSLKRFSKDKNRGKFNK